MGERIFYFDFKGRKVVFTIISFSYFSGTQKEKEKSKSEFYLNKIKISLVEGVWRTRSTRAGSSFHPVTLWATLSPSHKANQPLSTPTLANNFGFRHTLFTFNLFHHLTTLCHFLYKFAILSKYLPTPSYNHLPRESTNENTHTHS